MAVLQKNAISEQNTAFPCWTPSFPRYDAHYVPKNEHLLFQQLERLDSILKRPKVADIMDLSDRCARL